jgi:hypothetical protein
MSVLQFFNQLICVDFKRTTNKKFLSRYPFISKDATKENKYFVESEDEKCTVKFLLTFLKFIEIGFDFVCFFFFLFE